MPGLLLYFLFTCSGGAALVYFGNQYMRDGFEGVGNTIQSVNVTVETTKRDVSLDGV